MSPTPQSPPRAAAAAFAIALAIAILGPIAARAQDHKPGPDAEPREGVPRGRIVAAVLNESRVYPGAEREYWVYVPPGADPARPLPLMVFQDGAGHLAPNGAFRTPTVFDNLIHEGAMPPVAAVFVNPGRVPPAREGAAPRVNRSFEYDTLGDRYARFLIDELLPAAEREAGVKFSENPDERAICGVSSGGICAFNVAWERPDSFRRVYSMIGSFTDLRGGHDLAQRVRKTEPKPLKIFLQDGDGDLNNFAGNWWLANLELHSALEFAGYDVKVEWGKDGHNPRHGGAILPEVLRWLWADLGTPLVPNPRGTGRGPVLEVVDAAEPWVPVSSGHAFTEGPAVGPGGEFYFSDIPNNRIHKVALDGTVSVFAADSARSNGLAFGPGGKLLACRNGDQTLVAHDPADGSFAVLARDLPSNDLAVAANGDVYVTDPANKRVWLVPAAPPGGERPAPIVVDEGIERPNGVVLSPDQTFLYVADTRGRYVYSFQVRKDGRLEHKQPFFRLDRVDDSNQSGADGMTVDENGRLYVATELGIQIFDLEGRSVAILPKPGPGRVTNLTFAGPDLDQLVVTNGDLVFKRKVKVRGLRPETGPVAPKPMRRH